MEYAAIFMLWAALVFLVLWKRTEKADGREALFRLGFLFCTISFVFAVYIWNYIFR